MRKTDNFELNLLDAEAFVNREDLNGNAEKIDEILKKHDTPEYDVAQQKDVEELTSGESLRTALRKLAKVVKEFISHTKDKISHLTEEEHKELAGLIRLDITGETVDVNKYTLSSGSPKIMRIISKTNGGSSNITNIPITGFPFIMDIELIRWASATDYITRQKFVNANNPANEYVRYCTNGVWGAWVTRVFTDTKTTIAANLTTTTTGYALDATMGKKLQDNKVDKVSGKGLSTNDYTTAEKTKLAGIADGANKTTVDSALSSSSTNPVQNKIVTEQINQLLGLIATQLGSSIKWKNATSCYINGELGTCYYICMTEEDTTNNVGKEVLVFYNNGAIAKGKIVKSGSYYGLENPVTFLTDTTLPLVNKTTIQGGTNTLPYSNNGTIGYCVTPGYGYGATFEISKTNTFTTKYLILN